MTFFALHKTLQHVLMCYSEIENCMRQVNDLLARIERRAMYTEAQQSAIRNAISATKHAIARLEAALGDEVEIPDL